MTERRFLVDPAELQGGPGGVARVTGDEHHHLSRVLRLRAEDPVWLFDGAGRGFSGTIDQVGIGDHAALFGVDRAVVFAPVKAKTAKIALHSVLLW